MSLTPEQRKEADDIAELRVRRYFDHYLQNVLPKEIEAHDNDPKAHGGVEHKFNRVIALILGVALASGGVGAVLTRIIASL